jgi:CDGSH-type Zn-finger protein
MGMYDKKAPYMLPEEPKTQAVCSCGKTGNPPYCDGSHKGTGKEPTIIQIESGKTVAICGCGKSGNLPYCDGSCSKQ